MEGGFVRRDDLNAKQLNKVRELLADLKLKSSAKYRDEWGDESNRLMHNDAYKRLLKAVLP